MIRVFASNRRAAWEDVVSVVLNEFMAGYEFEAWNFDVEKYRKDALSIPQSERALDYLIVLFYRHWGDVNAPGKRLWGDKTTPGSFEFLHKIALVFPRAKYVHIVRDGRDCVASAMKAGFFNEDAETAATAWRDNVQFCRNFGSQLHSPTDYLEVRYEELVNDPDSCIPHICGFLNVAPHAAIFQGDSEVTTELQDVVSISHHANVSKPVFSSSIGKWKKAFTTQELTRINQIMASELLRFGYKD